MVLGAEKGEHNVSLADLSYAVNVPLRDGITDESYKSIFEPVRRMAFFTHSR